jgi:hypothetical protein
MKFLIGILLFITYSSSAQIKYYNDSIPKSILIGEFRGGYYGERYGSLNSLRRDVAGKDVNLYMISYNNELAPYSRDVIQSNLKSISFQANEFELNGLHDMILTIMNSEPQTKKKVEVGDYIIIVTNKSKREVFVNVYLTETLKNKSSDSKDWGAFTLSKRELQKLFGMK